MEAVYVFARYIGDYLAYAVIDDSSLVGDPNDDSYWPDYYETDEGETEYLYNVPIDIAQKLARQGTNEQWYSDGYEAASEAARYLKKG